MISNILDKIKLAEEEANALIEEALVDAKRVNLEAEEEVIKMKETALQEMAQERSKAVESAKKDALDSAENIFQLGNKEIDRLNEESRIDEAVDFIVAEFFTSNIKNKD